jgi:2-dehydropantoate 2-reductase
MNSKSDPRVAVVGAGAVGCYFGGMLARAGVDVTLIGRAMHMDAIERDGLLIDGVSINERVRVRTATAIDAVRGADIVLFCVKTIDTVATARELLPLIGTDAIVVSMQNGVDNAERIRDATGIEALPAVVYVAAMMTAPGVVKHTGRGDLVVGTIPDARDRTEDRKAVAALFERAGVPCRISDSIGVELWSKLVINCAYNAISALTRSNYGGIKGDPALQQVMMNVVAEVVAVANAAGVELDLAALTQAGLKLGDAMPGAVSSTAQDIARGKQTEIDSLNGFVAARGAELNVPTPLNSALHALVKRLEVAGK